MNNNNMKNEEKKKEAVTTELDELTDEQLEKYKALFWEPEIFIPTPNGMVVLHVKE